MRFEFADKKLESLYTDKGARTKFPQEVVRGFRKTMQLIAAASDMRDIRQVGGSRFEKLTGDRTGQHSLRLNRQWRLIVRPEHDEVGNYILIIEIVDYH